MSVLLLVGMFSLSLHSAVYSVFLVSCFLDFKLSTSLEFRVNKTVERFLGLLSNGSSLRSPATTATTAISCGTNQERPSLPQPPAIARNRWRSQSQQFEVTRNHR